MNPLAFVDVETTGLRPTIDRIIEIGIVRVENGQIVRTLNTLLNPQMYVSPMIEHITGISPQLLEDAPSFEDIEEDVYSYLEGAVFVAHNVRFDYSFLRNEFKRFGRMFKAKQLCTARLSRALFPQHRHHNLSSIIERFGLICEHRHRAYDDAHVLWQFYKKIHDDVAPDVVESATCLVQKRPALPPHLTSSDIHDLPETSGVYEFYDQSNTLLYIGKANNIRSRVMSHFSSDHVSAKELAMNRQIARIVHHVTAGELGALLRESYLVKSKQPLYNRVLRYAKKLYVLRTHMSKKTYGTVSLEALTSLDAHDIDTVIGVFPSKKKAREKLEAMAEKHHLCKKILQIEHAGSYCFGYHLGTCKGACAGKEPVVKYNLRLLLALAENRLKPWIFPSSIEIIEKNTACGISEQFIVDKWCLLHHSSDDTNDISLPTGYTLDLDTYKILRQYLKRNYSSGRTSLSVIIRDVREPLSYPDTDEISYESVYM